MCISLTAKNHHCNGGRGKLGIVPRLLSFIVVSNDSDFSFNCFHVVSLISPVLYDGVPHHLYNLFYVDKNQCDMLCVWLCKVNMLNVSLCSQAAVVATEITKASSSRGVYSPFCIVR